MYRSLTWIWLLSNAHLLGNVKALPSSAYIRERNITSKTADQTHGAKPKVFYLFMATQDPAYVDVWKTFLRQGTVGTDFECLFHCCKGEEDECGQVLADVGCQAIPRVKSEYFHNLVTPMTALYNSALDISKDPNDKFVIISDSTLPVKPLAHVQKTLLEDYAGKSSLCIWPQRTWKPFNDTSTGEYFVKTDQWTVLNREHAAKVAKRDNFAIEFEIGAIDGNANHGPMAADELFFYYAIYGTVRPPVGNQMTLTPAKLNDEKLIVVPLPPKGWTDELIQAAPGHQGVCHTFAYWHNGDESNWGSGTLKNADWLDEFAVGLEHSGVTYDVDWIGQRPAGIDELTTGTFKLLRESNFLFARKFNKKEVRCSDCENGFSEDFIQHILKK